MMCMTSAWVSDINSKMFQTNTNLQLPNVKLFFFFSKVEKINVASMDMDQSKKTDVTFWEICVKEQREIVKFMSRNMTQKITGYHYFANCQDAALN